MATKGAQVFVTPRDGKRRKNPGKIKIWSFIALHIILMSSQQPVWNKRNCTCVFKRVVKKKTAFRILEHSCSPLLCLLSAVNETVCTCPKCCLELVFRATVYSTGINTRGEKKTRVSRATSTLLHLCCGYSALLTQLKHRQTHATELPSFPLNPPIHVLKHQELSFVQVFAFCLMLGQSP